MKTRNNSRETKALSIIEQGYSITRVGKNHYRVLSQTNNDIYNVKQTVDADIWSCDCKDFTFRLMKKSPDERNCKHILSCVILRDSIEEKNNIEKIELPKVCPRCYSTTICKNGLRKIKNGIKRQRYACKQCKYKFIIGENGFSKVSSDPKIITEALNLIFSGVSYRNVARHIKITYQVKISHVSILNWFKKYTSVIKEYVDSLNPQTGDVWSVDEMVLNVKNTTPTGQGFYDWMWSIINPQTRFVLATEVSKRREVLDARKIFASGKEKTDSKPSYIITDSLRAYEEAVRKELDARTTIHIKTKSLKDGFQNRPIERYHNEIREKLKARRGLGNDESAQVFADGYRIYHNYCRPHSGLPDDITPAEASGINLGLGDNKIHDLIVKSSRQDNFVNQLGKRIEKVNIVNEKDCVKVTPKMWLEKQVWKEINDILKLSDFNWLSNGKDSCWIKLLHFTESN
jgi:transposase-like protein